MTPRLIARNAFILALAACVAPKPAEAPAPTPRADPAPKDPQAAPTAEPTPQLTPQQRARQQAIEEARAAGIIGPRTSVGGFMLQDVNSNDARAESANAIELLRMNQNDPSITLRTIRSFGSQIVSGMNYRFELDVTTASGPRAITLVMYENGDPDNLHREISSVTGL